ncbi:hypothetical protein FD50_GL000892 [Liquorilactobacillus satsumensis DSM 16230 = JCM 12392]|uniref:Uncharacterized protein n=1 Tax=Liquorilactobacillus satsumensis DSM 16230 = JCM 12392 TaxID=1423801 RepID=A0A0R1VBZ8_9LACO|nr:hypothetical protein FD50_GL000892 [Liquorilactobacillus satsumensis DSM 16230 = JCM 12392]
MLHLQLTAKQKTCTQLKARFLSTFPSKNQKMRQKAFQHLLFGNKGHKKGTVTKVKFWHSPAFILDKRVP